MKQRAKILIECPDGMDVAILEWELKKLKCKVEIQTILNPLEGFKLPTEFKFKEEKKVIK